MSSRDESGGTQVETLVDAVRLSFALVEPGKSGDRGGVDQSSINAWIASANLSIGGGNYSAETRLATLGAAMTAVDPTRTRRLSRSLAPSDFDAILRANETIKLAEGRDETTLGRFRGSRGALDDSPASVPSPGGSPRRKHSGSPGQRYSAGVSSHRRPSGGSLYRSSDSNSSPDLAKISPRTSSMGRMSAERPRTPERQLPTIPSQDSGLTTKGFTTPRRGSSPTATPERQTSATLHTPPSKVRSPLPAPLPVAKTVGRSFGLSVTTASQAAKSEDRLIPSTSRETASSGRFDYGSSPRRGSLGDNASSAFSSTMRKTSRFFKKLSGSSSGNAGTSSSASGSTMTPAPPKVSNSAPGTPISNIFSHRSAVPPVPSIPAVYAPVASTSRISSDRQDSVDITISSQPLKQLSPVIDSVDEKPEEEQHLRRRSISMGPSAASLLMPGLLHANTSPAGSSTSPGSARSMEETDKLRAELERWRLDIDGVLGAIEDGSSTASSSRALHRTSAPPGTSLSATSSPRRNSARPASTPVVTHSAPVSPEQDKRRPTWDANFAKDYPEVVPLPPPRRGSLPAMTVTATATSPSDLPASLPGSVASSSSSSAGPSAPFTPATGIQAPSIRLVSPKASLTDLNPPKEATLPLAGLGLHTIVESSHSRNGSLTTPPKLDSSDPFSTPLPPPILTTQSPSPMATATETMFTTPASNRKLARHSVVCYPVPGTSPSIGSRTPSASKASSMTSLGDGMARRGSGKSLDGSSCGEEGASPMIGTAFADRAKEFAQKCWDEDSGFLETKKIAEWLGSTGRLNVAALRWYMDFFDFTGFRVDAAFRRLCEKLYLKAETQQVDRILEQFSRRYWDNNPQSAFGSADVVHAVSYSLLLLNTDLHVVDATTRMSRQQFVRNTVEAIQAQTGDFDEPSALLFASARHDSESDVTAEASTARISLDRAMGAVGARRAGSINSWKHKESTTSMSSLASSPVKTRPSTATGVSSTFGSPPREREYSSGTGQKLNVELEEIGRAHV